MSGSRTFVAVTDSAGPSRTRAPHAPVRARSPRALLLAVLAVVLFGCGGAQRAESEPTTRDPLASVSGEELFERGVALARVEDYIRAEQYFVSAMQRGFDEDRVMPLLLAACVRSSRISAALGYAEPYLERHPDAWSLRLLVATLYMGLEEHAQAHVHLRRVIDEHPDQASAHYMLGVLARDDLHDAAIARASFERYLALEPSGEHAEEARAALSLGTEALGSDSGAAPDDAAVHPVRLPRHDEPAPSSSTPTPAQEAP